MTKVKKPEGFHLIDEPSRAAWLGVLLSCGLLLLGCRGAGRSIEPGFASPVSETPKTSPGVPRSELQGRAYLTVTRLTVAPLTVHRGELFHVKVSIRNQGGQPSEAFEVQVQANLDTAGSVLSFPVGGMEEMKFRAGEETEVVLTKSDGLPRSGIYTITVDVLLTDGELADDTNRVNPIVPKARLIVK